MSNNPRNQCRSGRRGRVTGLVRGTHRAAEDVRGVGIGLRTVEPDRKSQVGERAAAELAMTPRRGIRERAGEAARAGGRLHRVDHRRPRVAVQLVKIGFVLLAVAIAMLRRQVTQPAEKQCAGQLERSMSAARRARPDGCRRAALRRARASRWWRGPVRPRGSCRGQSGPLAGGRTRPGQARQRGEVLLDGLRAGAVGPRRSARIAAGVGDLRRRGRSSPSGLSASRPARGGASTTYTLPLFRPASPASCRPYHSASGSESSTPISCSVCVVIRGPSAIA